MAGKFCAACGKELTGQEKFCMNCGKPAGAAATSMVGRVVVFVALVAVSAVTALVVVSYPHIKQTLDPEAQASNVTPQQSNESGVDTFRGLEFASQDELKKIRKAPMPCASGEDLPKKADLSRDMPVPGYQGKQNSCTAWAIAYCVKTYQEKREEKWSLLKDSTHYDMTHIFSPAFIFNQLNGGKNSGVSIPSALDFVKDHGVASWEDAPYRESDYRTQPSETAKSAAYRYRIYDYSFINPKEIMEMKSQVATGNPVIVAAMTDQGFANANASYVWRKADGEEVGAHAMVIIGYDDSRQAFKLMNSWSTHWGDKGYGWIAYSHVPTVVKEAYVVMDAVNDRPDNVDNFDDLFGDNRTKQNEQFEFTLTKVDYNVKNPQDAYDQRVGMRFEGSYALPGGIGRVHQLAIHFFYDDNGIKGAPVYGAIAHFTTSDGQAACSTAVYSIPPEGIRNTWWTWIPYDALDVPYGRWVRTNTGTVYQRARTNLIASGTMYVDYYGVASNRDVRFYLER